MSALNYSLTLKTAMLYWHPMLGSDGSFLLGTLEKLMTPVLLQRRKEIL